MLSLGKQSTLSIAMRHSLSFFTWHITLSIHRMMFLPTSLCSGLDIVATAAAVAGISLPTDRVYDGLNIVPYLAGEQVSPVRTLFWRQFGLGPDGPPGSEPTIWAVRRGPLKLVVERAKDDQPPALYNLINDIGETQDLAAIQPDDVTALTKLYAQWTLDTIPPIWEKPSG